MGNSDSMTGSNDAAMSLIGEITNQMARLVRGARSARSPSRTSYNYT